VPAASPANEPFKQYSRVYLQRLGNRHKFHDINPALSRFDPCDITLRLLEPLG
jgi:hypothetical protein